MQIKIAQQSQALKQAEKGEKENKGREDGNEAAAKEEESVATVTSSGESISEKEARLIGKLAILFVVVVVVAVAVASAMI